MSRIRSDVLSVLRESRLDGSVLRLPGMKLERSLYVAVNEVIERCSGKWDRKRGGHVFPYPADVLEVMFGDLCESGLMPEKNPLDFFPTPLPVIDIMFDLLDASEIPTAPRILEPSAGSGSIAKVLRGKFPAARIDTVELDEINCVLLERQGFDPFRGRFEDYNPDCRYDLIMMNPPFNIPGDRRAYISHALKAFALLRDGGQMVTIAPNSFRFASDKKSVEFLNHVGLFGVATPLPDRAFAESGTGVQAWAILLRQQDVAWRAAPVRGWQSFDDFELSTIAVNDYEFDRFAVGADGKTDQEWMDAYSLAIRKANLECGTGFVMENIHYPDLIAKHREDYGIAPVLPAGQLNLFGGDA